MTTPLNSTGIFHIPNSSDSFRSCSFKFFEFSIVFNVIPVFNNNITCLIIYLRIYLFISVFSLEWLFLNKKSCFGEIIIWVYIYELYRIFIKHPIQANCILYYLEKDYQGYIKWIYLLKNSGLLFFCFQFQLSRKFDKPKTCFALMQVRCITRKENSWKNYLIGVEKMQLIRRNQVYFNSFNVLTATKVIIKD